MSFFPPLPDDAPPEATPPSGAPSWSSPPQHTLPGPIHATFEIEYTDRVFIGIERLNVYPTGITFCLRIVLRDEADRPRMPFRRFPPRRRTPGDELRVDEVLRIGVEYPDGSRAVDPIRPDEVIDMPAPESPVIVPKRGSWGARGGEHDFWLTPAPPPGALTFVIAWPVMGLPETRTQVDAGTLAHARLGGRTLWG